MTVEPSVTVPVEPDHHMLCAVLAKFPKLASMEMVRKIYAVMLSTAAPPPAPDADARRLIDAQLRGVLATSSGYASIDPEVLTAIVDYIASHASRQDAEIRTLRNAGVALLDRAEAAERQVATLEAENFALAANQCHEGYAGEHGDHMCRIEDRLKAAERQVAEAVAAERERCAKIADVAAEQWRTSERSAKAKGADYTASFIGGSALAASNIARSIRAGDKGGAG